MTLDMLTARDPQAMLRVAIERGVNVRSTHALHAAAHPDRLAIVDARRSYTWRQLDQAINRAANLLREDHKLGPGRPALLAMQNRAEYIVCWMALFRLGAPVIHASWRSSAEELCYQLDHSRAACLIADSASLPAALDATARAASPTALLYVADDDEQPPAPAVELTRALRSRSTQWPSRDVQSSENIVYTSGTTGRPKGASRNFGRLGAAELFRVLDRLPLEAGERHLIVSPLYHSGAQVFALMQSALGSTLYIEPHFEAEQTLKALSRWNIHSVFLVPTMIRRLLELPDALYHKYPIESLRVLIAGAAPFKQALRERAIARFGAERVYDFYGATEVGWVTLIRGDQMLKHLGSVGQPIAGQEVTILDERGVPCPTGHPGLVYVRNDQSIEHYLRDADATSRARHDGGWFTVEDTGHLDADGFLYITGRARDMVISGGVNIYPVEIEEVLARHPALREVAVVGVPDEEWGESLVAVYASHAEVEEAELEAFARTSLSGYKVPRRWVRVEELPRNPTGKVLKRTLREQLATI
jgi:fatty-acyl-CoA synthase